MAVQTTQSTGKLWKALKLLSIMGLFVGALMAVAFPPEHPGASSPLFGAGLAVAVGSLPLYVFARAGAWWFHG